MYRFRCSRLGPAVDGTKKRLHVDDALLRLEDPRVLEQHLRRRSQLAVLLEAEAEEVLDRARPRRLRVVLQHGRVELDDVAEQLDRTERVLRLALGREREAIRRELVDRQADRPDVRRDRVRRALNPFGFILVSVQVFVEKLCAGLSMSR